MEIDPEVAGRIARIGLNRENTRPLSPKLPKRYQAADLKDFDQNNLKPVIGWVNNPDQFVFVHAGSGVGKTHLAAAVVKALCLRGIDAGIVVGADIFLRLRKSFDRDANESEWDIINKYRNPKVVGVFDDVAATGCRDYVIEAWYNIINHRYNECIPTLFTSNMSLGEIANIMGDRIASRLASGIVFELPGKDRRIIK